MKLNIHWDPEADHLEIRFGVARPSYYEEIGDDIFERRDEVTDQITGYMLFNVKKRERHLDVELPVTDVSQQS